MTLNKTQKKASLSFIFFTVMLDMVGIGLVIPVLPDIMRRFLTDETSVSQYFGYFVALYALMQFVASPLLGSLSDRYGRRPILLISILVAAADYFLMAFSPTLLILFIGRVISGLTGANITTAMAYIADISDDKNRAANFGTIGAAFGLGFIIGPAIGGIVGNWGSHYPFLIAASLNLLNFLFGLFILPESLPTDKRRAFSWANANPLISLKNVIFAGPVAAMMFMTFCLQFAGNTHPSIWTLYTESRFGWGPAEVGLSLAAVGIFTAISQGLLTRLIIPRIGEERSVFWGALGLTFSMLFFGLATQGWMMYAVLGVSSIFWVYGPALQSLISKSVSEDQQGELQGTLVSLASLSSVLNPLIMTQVFSWSLKPDTDKFWMGSPYFVAAATSLLGFIAFVIFRPKSSKTKTSQRS